MRGTADNVGVVLKDKRAGSWETAVERNGSYYQFDEEADALLTDTEPPVSVDEARWTVKLQEAIRDSVRSTETDQQADSPTEAATESEVPSDD